MIFLFLALNIFILNVDVKILSLGIIQDFQVNGSIQGLGFQGLVFLYGLVQGLSFDFCVMEWLNFGIFFLTDKWWVWESYDQTNVWLPMYLLDRRIRSSHSSFLFTLIFAQATLFKFLAQQALSLSFPFFTLLLRRFPFWVFNLLFFLRAMNGNNIIYNHFRCGVFRLPP